LILAPPTGRGGIGFADDGFDRECVKTIRGAPAHFNLSFRAVVDFD
jgi:hypothetical protein